VSFLRIIYPTTHASPWNLNSTVYSKLSNFCYVEKDKNELETSANQAGAQEWFGYSFVLFQSYRTCKAKDSLAQYRKIYQVAMTRFVTMCDASCGVLGLAETLGLVVSQVARKFYYRLKRIFLKL